MYTFAHFLGNSCALLGNEPKFPNLETFCSWSVYKKVHNLETDYVFAVHFFVTGKLKITAHVAVGGDIK